MERNFENEADFEELRKDVTIDLGKINQILSGNDPASVTKEHEMKMRIKEIEEDFKKREADEKVNKLLAEKERIDKRLKIYAEIKEVCDCLDPVKLIRKIYSYFKK